MNFLAHLFLSGNNSSVLVGNFIADFVKGKAALQQFSPEVLKGIELHRAIDHFTDHHPIVDASKNRLRKRYRHYSAVIVDVFYDHHLAQNWKKFSPDPLSTFALRSYDQIQQAESILPNGVKEMLPYMIKGNWLVSYGTMEGIGRALTGMSHRTPYVSYMDEAVKELQVHYVDFENEFLDFFPELQVMTRAFLDNYTLRM